MVLRLDASDPGFAPAFDEFVARGRDGDGNVRDAVAGIIARVRAEGFAAVAGLTARFDGHGVDETTARVSADDLDRASHALDPELLAALRLAADRIRAFHEKQRPDDYRETDAAGLTLGWRWTPVDAAGLYAPGGRAAYPSSVLMNAIPAKAAGVERLVMCAPTPGGVDNPVVLAAAALAGVDEVWRIGGAQAIAAMAFGAGPIRPVDVVVGPGNAYVAEAKRQVFGDVGLDAVAGPSEIAVIADAANDPRWIAADLLSQAEHDPTSQAVLLTDDSGFADAVASAAAAQLADHPRKDIAETAWRENSAIIVVGSIRDAAALVDRLAPEHLELAVEHPEALLALVRHAGAIFLGRHAPEALGDYLAGPNHVLPTSGAARYASGLSTLTFMKRTTIVGADANAIAAVGAAAARLADAEGLPGHALSIRLRLAAT
ncbi:MAG: histidinol dehydrogenase [Alphaproteobacteria bacterium]|nr:histidinol dehydrogenase [Alphaproteobacteria bacterium]